MSFLLLLAVGSYMAFAINLFKSDKTAYIYESHSLLTDSLGSEIQSLLVRTHKSMRSLAQNVLIEKSSAQSENWETSQTLFREEPDFVATTVFEVKTDNSGQPITEKISSFSNQDFLDMNSLTSSDIEQLLPKGPDLAKQMSDYDLLGIHNLSHSNGTPMLGMTLKLKAENDLLIITLIKYERLLNLISKSKMHTTYIIDKFANVLVHPDNKLVISHSNLAENIIVKQILALETASGAQEFQEADGRKFILSFNKIGQSGLVLISQIPTERAFLATRQLTKKSVFFALALVGIFFAASIVFSKHLTSALFLLLEATKKVSQGEFDISIKNKSKDEIGSLTESFLAMTKEIKRLLLATADKARMEKELETAKLVQENLFPTNHFESDTVKVSAYFAPASECGGDWWGQMVIGRDLYILIGDATGHGVPAALITAAAQSCCTTLEQLARVDSDFQITPALILEVLNNAVFESAKGRIKMTFFVLKIDLDGSEMKYSNASHEMPIICRKPEDNSEERSKDDVDVLIGEPDKSLGTQANSKYQEFSYQLKSGDVILLYTDGLTEGRNPEKQEFGEKKLMRSLIKFAHLTPKEITESLLTSAQDFYQEATQDDDITFVVVKIDESAKAVRVAL